MARKNFKAFQLLDQQSLATNFTSQIVNVQTTDKASIHISWAGTAPVGVFTVEARNSADDAWATIDMGAPISVSGASGDHLLVFNEVPFYELRLQYAATSGTGTVDAVLNMKQVGG